MGRSLGTERERGPLKGCWNSGRWDILEETSFLFVLIKREETERCHALPSLRTSRSRVV